jgi:hypothetical protein
MGGTIGDSYHPMGREPEKGTSLILEFTCAFLPEMSDVFFLTFS